MNVIINGKPTDVPDALSVEALLKHQAVKMPDMVSVELNGEILERKTFDQTLLKTDDRIELLYFMGGGSRVVGSVRREGDAI